jgi:hypothetical protein
MRSFSKKPWAKEFTWLFSIRKNAPSSHFSHKTSLTDDSFSSSAYSVVDFLPFLIIEFYASPSQH